MVRDKNGRFVKGNTDWKRSSWHSDKARKKMSQTKKGKPHSKEHKIKIGLATIKSAENPQYRLKISNSLKGIKRSKETKNKISDSKKEQWKDKSYREKSIKNILKSLMKRPTSYEQKIIDLCDKHNLPFKYVGDGQVIIAGLNPDFIETNGRKIVIETYCKYWHYKRNKNYEGDRQRKFSKYGYNIIFLNEDELCNKKWEEKCLQKIKSI